MISFTMGSGDCFYCEEREQKENTIKSANSYQSLVLSIVVVMILRLGE